FSRLTRFIPTRSSSTFDTGASQPPTFRLGRKLLIAIPLASNQFTLSFISVSSQFFGHQPARIRAFSIKDKVIV
ncbi:hypothetical protein Csa_023634, partial [Cucumis sativus]